MDVLDLHSNKISRIENINHLADLRVLNLANNLITNVSNLTGLFSLTELNLRRNLIDSVQGLQACSRLQRVFLSNNRIDKFESINCVKDCAQLSELALDGNPLHQKKGYAEQVLKACQHLKQLDNRKITPEMRNDPTTINIEEGKTDLNQTADNDSTTGISHSEGLQMF